MRFDIITIFSQIFNSYLNESILKRAQKRGLIKIKIHNLRDFANNKHRKIDDRPFGGGPGMVIKVEPLVKAIHAITKSYKPKAKSLVVLFTPAGKQFNNKMAGQLAKKYKQLILICGRYEGIDERAKKVIKDSGLGIMEVSVGPFVLTGGELPAMVLIDSISRQVPGVLGKSESIEERRSGIGIPVYTRPEIFVYKGDKYRAPKVLLSGNHKKIEEWRRKFIKNSG